MRPAHKLSDRPHPGNQLGLETALFYASEALFTVPIALFTELFNLVVLSIWLVIHL